MIEQIKGDNFQELVVNSDKVVLLDFYASWCGPCKAITPILEGLADDYSEVLTVGKVNVEHEPDLAYQYQVRGVPTLVFMKGGKIMSRKVGMTSKGTLVEELSKIVDLLG